MVDDVIGTGQTAIESLNGLNDRIADLLQERGISLFLAFICGFEESIAKVQDEATRLKFPLKICCSDLLSETDRAFSESSSIFEAAEDRRRAKELAQSRGAQLEKKWPLGHGDSEALIVFYGNCPNNTLPIIYKDGTDWTSLFPRR